MPRKRKSNADDPWDGQTMTWKSMLRRANRNPWLPSKKRRLTYIPYEYTAEETAVLDRQHEQSDYMLPYQTHAPEWAQYQLDRASRMFRHLISPTVTECPLTGLRTAGFPSSDGVLLQQFDDQKDKNYPEYVRLTKLFNDPIEYTTDSGLTRVADRDKLIAQANQRKLHRQQIRQVAADKDAKFEAHLQFLTRPQAEQDALNKIQSDNWKKQRLLEDAAKEKEKSLRLKRQLELTTIDDDDDDDDDCVYELEITDIPYHVSFPLAKTHVQREKINLQLKRTVQEHIRGVRRANPSVRDTDHCVNRYLVTGCFMLGKVPPPFIPRSSIAIVKPLPQPATQPIVLSHTARRLLANLDRSKLPSTLHPQLVRMLAALPPTKQQGTRILLPKTAPTVHGNQQTCTPISTSPVSSASLMFIPICPNSPPHFQTTCSSSSQIESSQSESPVISNISSSLVSSSSLLSLPVCANSSSPPDQLEVTCLSSSQLERSSQSEAPFNSSSSLVLQQSSSSFHFAPIQSSSPPDSQEIVVSIVSVALPIKSALMKPRTFRMLPPQRAVYFTPPTMDIAVISPPEEPADAEVGSLNVGM